MIFCEQCGAEIKNGNLRFDEKNWHRSCYERMREAKRWEIPKMCSHCHFQINERDTVLKYLTQYYGNYYHTSCYEKMMKGDK